MSCYAAVVERKFSACPKCPWVSKREVKVCPGCSYEVPDGVDPKHLTPFEAELTQIGETVAASSPSSFTFSPKSLKKNRGPLERRVYNPDLSSLGSEADNNDAALPEHGEPEAEPEAPEAPAALHTSDGLHHVATSLPAEVSANERIRLHISS